MDRRQLIKHLNPEGLGIEIGVQSGDYAKMILEESNLHLILLDSWRELTEYPDKGNVTTAQHLVLMNNSLKTLSEFEGRFTLMRELSEVAVDWFKDDFFGCMYMDANHSDKFVYYDLVKWRKKIKK